MSRLALVCLAALAAISHGQRITTIQLEGVQYFISRMNPYSPELNYFLAYQYCRSIGLQLVSFETKEKADSIMQYLSNAGYNKYDFWTSGNRLGTDMLIWMSTGLPFNATFDYMKKKDDQVSNDPVARQLSAVEQKTESGAHDGCVALTAPYLQWATQDCTRLKDFVCEQTRCYYYNYGSIQVSSSQGRSKEKPPQTFAATTTTQITTASYEESGETDQPIDYSTEQAPSQAVHSQETDYSTDAVLGTTEPINIRSQKSQALESGHSNEFGVRTISNNNENDSINNDFPWPWARNIMLEKPKKKNSA